ncbi:MAG: hypothetical protein RLY40_881 [Pseudomonadota bacterium]|jgi:hypothetical protein
MIDQLSIERKYTQGTRAATTSSATSSNERKRRLSGPNSQGERALIKKDPIWLVNSKAKIPVFNSCLYSFDEVVATPAFNVNVIESAYDKDFKLFDVIKSSKYVGFIDSALVSLSFLAASIGIYVIQYCKLREIEKNSNYFYYSRLFQSFNEQEIKSKMGEINQNSNNVDDLITYEYLQTAAYFYPPDISPIACWRRRLFASKIKKRQIAALDIFLKNSKKTKLDKLFKEIKNKRDNINNDNQSLYNRNIDEYLQTAEYFYSADISRITYWKRRFFSSKEDKERRRRLDKFLNSSLDELHKKITEQVSNFLNIETKYKYFKVKKDVNDNWIIALDEGYREDFFTHVDHLIKENSKATEEKNRGKKNNIFLPILSAFGLTSFIYWVLVFLFYFFPITIITPVVSAALISVVPVALSLCVCLPVLLFFTIRNAKKNYNIDKNMSKETIEDQHKHMLEKKLTLLNKQTVYLDLAEDKQNKEVTTPIQLKDSSLLKELHAVLKKRRFSKYHAIFMGFLEGCFLPIFVGWVLLDATKVILTYVLCPSNVALINFTPIGLLTSAIIAVVVLIIGIAFGIYKACEAKKNHNARFNDLEDKIKALEKERGNKIILEKDYDRILRRFSSTKPLWTDLKKGINRFMAIVKRLGTGSLVFRLVFWAPIMAVYAAIVASTAVPPCFPIVLIIGTAIGALALASWYLYAYNIESKTTRAQRIVEYFVQNEQLFEINQIVTYLPKSLVKQDSMTEASKPCENLVKSLVKSENDTVLQEDESSQDENTPAKALNEVTIQTEARQRSNSNSCPQQLFGVNGLVHNENNLPSLSPSISLQMS